MEAMPRNSNSAGVQPDYLGAIHTAENKRMLRVALCHWIESRWQASDAKVVEAWLAQLHDGRPFWIVGGGRLPGLLSKRFATGVSIFRRLSSNPPSQPPEALQQWLDFCRAIAEHWSPNANADWEFLLVELPRQGNLLVDGIVAGALAAVMQAGCLDRSTRVALVPLLHSALAWTNQLDLFPAPGHSEKPDDYLLLYREGDLCEEIESTSKLIVAKLTALHDDLAKLIPPSGDRTIVNDLTTAMRGIGSAQEKLQNSVVAGRQGWPKERSTLQTAVKTLLSTLTDFGRLSHPLLLGNKDAILDLTKQLEKSCNLLWENAAIDFPPDSASSEPRQPVVANITGGSDNKSANAPISSGKDCSISAPLPTLEAPSWYTRIVALSGVLRQFQDPAALAFLPRLADLATCWQSLDTFSQKSVTGDAARQLVTCLLILDDYSQKPSQPHWLEQVREALRAILAEEGSYLLIDRELLGSELSAKEAQAEACGLTESPTVKPGRIARIQRPGYALVAAAGGQKILRKARVLLSR